MLILNLWIMVKILSFVQVYFEGNHFTNFLYNLIERYTELCILSLIYQEKKKLNRWSMSQCVNKHFCRNIYVPLESEVFNYTSIVTINSFNFLRLYSNIKYLMMKYASIKIIINNNLYLAELN